MLDKYFINLIVTDTAGQERFKSITEYYYKKADSIILSYDITNRKSFEECKTYYCKKIKELCKPNIKTILIGNKKDLDEMREVTFIEGNDFALSNEYIFMETSCKRNENVYETFEKIIDATFKEKLNEVLIDKKFNENEKIIKKKSINKYKNNCFII